MRSGKAKGSPTSGEIPRGNSLEVADRVKLIILDHRRKN